MAASITIYATSNYNATGPVCWIASQPFNCENDPDVECSSIGNPNIWRWVGGPGPLFVAFIGNCVILAVIWWAYCSQVQRDQACYSSPFANLESPTTQNIQIDNDEEEQSQLPTSCC